MDQASIENYVGIDADLAEKMNSNLRIPEYKSVLDLLKLQVACTDPAGWAMLVGAVKDAKKIEVNDAL